MDSGVTVAIIMAKYTVILVFLVAVYTNTRKTTKNDRRNFQRTNNFMVQMKIETKKPKKKTHP